MLERHTASIEKMAASTQAIGMRYRIFAEKAFREAARYLVEDLLKAYKVQRWIYYDDRYMGTHLLWRWMSWCVMWSTC